MIIKILILCLSILLVVGCGDTNPFIRQSMQGDPALRPNDSQVITFYALGDWGTGNQQQKAVAEALRQNVARVPKGRETRPFVIGLGDNVYEHGLPEGWNNPNVKTLLFKTFGEVYKDTKYEGQEIVFHMIPGNHDYNGKAGGKRGWGDVIQQETTAERIFFPNWRYYPIDPLKNSDADDRTNYDSLKRENILSLTLPEKIKIDKCSPLSILAIDTQVLLDLYKKEDTSTILIQQHWNHLEELLDKETGWKIIVGHHPIRSHGHHGGFRPPVEWLWSGTRSFIPRWLRPLTVLWLPFLSTGIDKLFVKRLQDLNNSTNKKFQKDLTNIMNEHDVKIYLSGHEHSLQFLNLDKNNFQIISGSSGKLSTVGHKDDTLFSLASPGFVRFDVTTKETWIEFFQVDVKKSIYRSSALYRITNDH